MTKRRVVVTGIGAVSPFGCSVKKFWDSIIKGESGIKTLTRIPLEGHLVHFGGEVSTFDDEVIENNLLDVKEMKRMDRFTQFACVASDEAMKDSGLDMTKEDPYKVGDYTDKCTQVCFVFSCPGRAELIAGMPCQGATGDNLNILLKLLNEKLPDLFTSPNKEDYDILSMTNGKRVMSVNSAGPGQICYSNPKTAAHFIKKLKEWIPADRKDKEKWQYPVLYSQTQKPDLRR